MQASLIGQAGQLAKSPAGEALTQQMMNGGTQEAIPSRSAGGGSLTEVQGDDPNPSK